MKRNILRSLFSIILLSGLIVSATSCSKDDKIAETQWKIINIKVNKGDWTWNNDGGFYTATANLPELTEFIFDNGAAVGYYKFNDNAKTVLPFVKTYWYNVEEGGVNVTKYFTETISCDFALGNPSTVTFHLEMSDLAYYDNGVPNDMNFQVVLIW